MKQKTIALCFMVCALLGILWSVGHAQSPTTNPKLIDLPANQWVAIHQQARDDKVRFKRQEHGGSCLDTKRCRIVLFGSNTHGEDWTNSPLIFDVVAGSWSRLYENDDKSTYRAAGDEGIAVAGVNGDHPWAMHTFGTVQYDPQRDEMVVACWPEHLRPGKFTEALKDVWPTIKKHPTWTFSFETNKWTPLAGKPQQFFPYTCAFDSDRNVIIGYGGPGIWELAGDPRSWTRIESKVLCGYHNNAVYDTVNKSVLVFGSDELSNDMIVFNPTTKEHRKMPTPGTRPPKDQHTPMCFDFGSGKTVVIVDRGEKGTELTNRKAETWLYDLKADAWTQVPSGTLPFGCGMNYNMHYDPRHKVCLLVTEDFGKAGWPVTVYALRIDMSKIESN
jgi:hypothetical protein